MKTKSIPPVPAVLLSIISIQGGAAIAKSIFPIIGPGGTVALRIGISAILLSLIFKPNFKKLTKKQFQLSMWYGIILGAMNTSFYFSLSRIPLGLAVTLEFLGPLLLSIFSSKKAIDYLWALLACAGIVLLSPWSSNSNLDWIGIGLALLAGAFWAAYIVLGGKLSKTIDSKQAVSVGLLFASIITIPAGIIEGNLTQLSPFLLLLGLSIALLSSAIPYTLEMNALKHLSAKTFSILMSLEPAVGAVCGLIFLQEKLNFNEWLAIALVVIASIGATMFKSKQQNVAETLPSQF